MSWLSNLFRRKSSRAPAVELPPRPELERRPLADLHSYASRLGIDRYRLLRRKQLIDTLLGHAGQSNGARPETASEPQRAERERAEGKSQDLYAVTGVVDVTRRGHGFLRVHGFVKSTEDPYIARSQIRKLELRPGDAIQAQARRPTRSERYPSVVLVDRIEGDAPDRERGPRLDDRQPASPQRALQLSRGRSDIGGRLVELLAPIGPGQSGLITAPRGSGASTLLRELASSLAMQPDIDLFVVLLGADPGELDEWQRTGARELHASRTGDSSAAQSSLAQLAVERAKRSAERGRDAVVILDSATRLARSRASAGGRATEQPTSHAVEAVRRLFASARATQESGSLTIVTTVHAPEEGELEREIHSALADVANMEVVLDAELARAGMYPAIDALHTHARSDKDLVSAQEQQRLLALRSVIRSLEPREAWEFLSEKLRETDSNEQLLTE